MTPQERQMVDDLFDRLAQTESAPRDPDATAAIAQGLRDAPNAVYALVQTVLVQDEALKRANSRIQELEAGGAPEQNQSGGFLDSMRGAIFGQSQPRGSVPNVRPPETPNRPVWNSGQVLQQGIDRRDSMIRDTASPVRDTASPDTASPMARRKARWAAAAPFSAPPRRPRPAWSADRCCSAASAR